MNPYLMQKLASQRAAELRGPAENGHAAAGRAAARLSVRHRSGRVLMQIGLRLAGGSRDSAAWRELARRTAGPERASG